MKTNKTPDRISEIVAEMHSITEFAEGSISSSSNSYPVKDGTRRKAKPHWKFQSLGPRGKRKYKNIPAALVPRVRKKNGRRRLILPRPRLVNVIALVESIQRADAKERRKALPRFDEDLAKAASKDMAAYVGEVMSSVSFRSNAQGANGIRTKQVFTRFGWCEVRHPYRVGSPGESDVFKAFGVVQKMTPSASKVATTLAVTQGSFREAKDTLALLGCGNVSVSKLRKETLRVGESRLAALRKPARDVRQYSDAELRTPDGARRVPRTLVVMADGTNPPCTKADTAGVRGKNSAQAKSRQLRVTCACEYVNVTGKGAPIPIAGSFSYSVTDLGIGELTSLIHEQAVSRGSGTVPRVQCVADGEEALEKAMRDALPFARFTNDFMHAAGYLNTCCEKLGIADAAKEFRTCRAIMLRHGAGSAVDRIRRLYSSELESSAEASDALNYLDKRRDNMRYGWLRKHGYYISSCHIEAAARILVARRCKQAGMHWRHHNAACVCAIIAQLRSAA